MIAILWIAPALALAGPPTMSDLPTPGLDREYVVDGVIERAWRARSGDSEYTLILSRTGNFRVNEDQDLRSARLYATLYVQTGEDIAQRWVIRDRVDTCPVDVTVAFTDPPAAISDADGDGEPEFWVSYRIACRGDVSPATLKLIGYEGGQKYALRGNARIDAGNGPEGGDFQADAAFDRAPKLLEFARSQWTRVVDEHF